MGQAQDKQLMTCIAKELKKHRITNKMRLLAQKEILYTQNNKNM